LFEDTIVVVCYLILTNYAWIEFSNLKLKLSIKSLNFKIHRPPTFIQIGDPSQKWELNKYIHRRENGVEKLIFSLNFNGSGVFNPIETHFFSETSPHTSFNISFKIICHSWLWYMPMVHEDGAMTIYKLSMGLYIKDNTKARNWICLRSLLFHFLNTKIINSCLL
jgi:hypothetical protein